LLDHPEYIPESWKDKHVIFAGSVFQDAGGNKCVKALYWWDQQWQIKTVYLDEAYDDKWAAIKN